MNKKGKKKSPAMKMKKKNNEAKKKELRLKHNKSRKKKTGKWIRKLWEKDKVMKGKGA